MSSGSFHDGGSHTGSFHSSGSGSFGGFGGGGYDDGYYGGSGRGSGSGESDGFMSVFKLLVFSIVFLTRLVFDGVIPGYNIASFAIFFIAFIVFIPSLKERKRFAAIREIRKDNGKSYQSVWSSEYSENRVGNEHTWYGKFDKNFCIAFYDKEYGEDNKHHVIETVKRSSGIVWVSAMTWLVCAIACAICNLFFYELVIPIFERAYMTDQAFMFFDYLVAFLPSMLALTFAILSIVFVKVRDSLLYKCAVRVVKDNQAKDHKKVTESGIDRKLSQKWYYNNCPNCGALADYHLKTCQNCGSSLEVGTAAGGSAGAIHRLIKTEDDGDKS